MTTNNYDDSVVHQMSAGVGRRAWVEWKHISTGLTHCQTCLKLDKCWFMKARMPRLPQHEYCHCIVLPIAITDVVERFKTTSSIKKFTEYLFNPSNPQNKGKAKLFFLWGYDIEDSQWMVEESQRQARKKFLAGEYSLGELDEYGQRIHIQMSIKNRITGEMVVFRTAWIARPNGELVLVTPYGKEQ